MRGRLSSDRRCPLTAAVLLAEDRVSDVILTNG